MARHFFREPVSRSGFIPGFKLVSCPLAAPAVSCPVSCLVSCPVSYPLFGPRFQGWFHRSLLSAGFMPGFKAGFMVGFNPDFKAGFHGGLHCLVACAAFVPFAALAGLHVWDCCASPTCFSHGVFLQLCKIPVCVLARCDRFATTVCSRWVKRQLLPHLLLS